MLGSWAVESYGKRRKNEARPVVGVGALIFTLLIRLIGCQEVHAAHKNLCHISLKRFSLRTRGVINLKRKGPANLCLLGKQS